METTPAEEGDRTRLLDLPKACVAHVIALTSPRDACRCAAVSHCFCDVAESDTVWARFLPSDYPAILQLNQLAPAPPSTKKEAYLGLADVPVLVDGGGMAVWLAKGSVAKCVALSARRLSLPWEDGEFSRRWMPHPLSRYIHPSMASHLFLSSILLPPTPNQPTCKLQC